MDPAALRGPELLQNRLEFRRAMMVSATPGVVRRVTPRCVASAAPETNPKEQETVDESKRNTLKLLAIGGLVAVGAGAGTVGALQLLQPPMEGVSAYPRTQLFYDDGSPIIVSQYKYTYKDNGQIIFDYPLTNEPNMLLNINQLGNPAPQNALPKGDGTYLVAYSAICQHLGCIPPYISYYPPGQCGSYNGGNSIIHCVCHGSTYDPSVRDTSNGGGAKILSGPTVLPIPQTLLTTDSSGYLYAVGSLGVPVKGHTSTLAGGQGVTSAVKASSPETPTQTCPT